MLSFLREQGFEDSSVNGPSAGGKIPDSGTGPAQEQEYLTVADQGNNTRKSTAMLIVLLAVGLLCLWFMIKKSTPQTSSATTIDTEETQIEIAITRLTGVRSEMFSRMDEIVKKFYEFSNIQQVKVSELVKNPFKLEIFFGNAKVGSDTEELGIDPEILRQQRLRQQAKQMQLLSIMATDGGNCCMIDDKILYEGDSIKDFNVRHIDNSFVKLESEGMEVILKLLE